MFLDTLSDVIAQMRWKCYGYCLMDNHYHLIIETPEANLSRGMRQLNGVFTQNSNRRHGRCGHLFQGRFKSIVVAADVYLLELSRYVVLNPVRAGMVADPADWLWSSYWKPMNQWGQTRLISAPARYFFDFLSPPFAFGFVCLAVS
ncbi:MAG: transposase, partial [Mariprofundaceae bacterium]|nr:transposase [Mariprofundaceae bacterium]